MIQDGEKAVRGRKLNTRAVRRQSWELVVPPLAMKGGVNPHHKEQSKEQRPGNKHI